MRFVGLVLVLIGLAVGYFLGLRGLTFNQARDRLAQLLNLPGLSSTPIDQLPGGTAGLRKAASSAVPA